MPEGSKPSVEELQSIFPCTAANATCARVAVTKALHEEKGLVILCGYMVQELLCNHLVAPIFGSPRAMFCRNLFEFCILRKWSHLEVLQKAWLLPLGHWVAADSTGPKARRKHKSDAVVTCRRQLPLLWRMLRKVPLQQPLLMRLVWMTA